ncbi:MAG TPA: lamin tail domain-containing protein, partial [Verrucomicrobiae bacterium]
LPGGGISPSARTYSGPVSVTQNSRITARARNLTHHNLTGANCPPLSSPWSGINSEIVIVQPISIAITEIMYHPGDSAVGTNAAADCEFIELKNLGATPCSLIGLQFTNGIQFAFTSTNAITNLAPGEYVLLVKSRDAFLERYPGVTNIAGEYAGSLDNSGERLQLVGPLGEMIADFRYEDFWYPDTDGNGASLVAVNENAPASEMQNADFWRPSSSTGGSPGSRDLENPFALKTSVQNDQITITFAAGAGRSYTIQTAENVAGPWQGFLNVPTASTNRVLTIADGIDSERRFYRIISPQQP